MSHRMPGETLATSDRVAMMPTVQPAATGTHEYLDVGRARGGLVRVIGREDIRSSLEMGVTTIRLGRCISRRDHGRAHPERHSIRETPTAGSAGRRAAARRAGRGTPPQR